MHEPACKELFDEFIENKQEIDLEMIFANLESAKACIEHGVEELQDLKRLILLTKSKFFRGPT